MDDARDVVTPDEPLPAWDELHRALVFALSFGGQEATVPYRRTDGGQVALVSPPFQAQRDQDQDGRDDERLDLPLATRNHLVSIQGRVTV